MMTQVATDYCACNIFEHVIHETWADEFTAFSTEKASNSEQTWHHILTFISTITLTPNFSTIISQLLNFHAKASEFANFTISMSTLISHCKVKKRWKQRKQCLALFLMRGDIIPGYFEQVHFTEQINYLHLLIFQELFIENESKFHQICEISSSFTNQK